MKHGSKRKTTKKNCNAKKRTENEREILPTLKRDLLKYSRDSQTPVQRPLFQDDPDKPASER